MHDVILTNGLKEPSDSVCTALDWGSNGCLFKTIHTVMCPWAWHFICWLVMVQSKKTGNNTNMTKIIDWDVNHQHK